MAMSAHRRARIQHAVDHHEEPRQSGETLMLHGYPGIVLRAPDGTVSPAGILYEQLLRDRSAPRRRGEHLEHYHPDARVSHLNGREQVEDRHGNMRTTRTWNPALNAGLGNFTYTRAGMRLTPKVSYLVNVPVTAHVREANGTIRTFDRNNNGRAIAIPVTGDMIGDLPAPGNMNACLLYTSPSPRD